MAIFLTLWLRLRIVVIIREAQKESEEWMEKTTFQFPTSYITLLSCWLLSSLKHYFFALFHLLANFVLSSCRNYFILLTFYCPTVSPPFFPPLPSLPLPFFLIFFNLLFLFSLFSSLSFDFFPLYLFLFQFPVSTNIS